MNNEQNKPMNNEPNKPIPAEELNEKELEGVSGGGMGPNVAGVIGSAVSPGVLTSFHTS